MCVYKRRCGFTLLELMVVLALILLMTASLPFAMNRVLPGRRVSVTAERLIADIRWLQIQSSITGAPGQLAVAPSGYRLEIREHGGRLVSLPASTTLRFCTPDAGCLARLRVYPDGTTSAGRFEIVDSGRHAGVDISMLTGKARRTN